MGRRHYSRTSGVFFVESWVSSRAGGLAVDHYVRESVRHGITR